MWENICHSLSLIQTLVFLLFVPAPRYTGLCRSKDDPSLFGKRPSVTRIPSTRRWKVLFSTLNWTCAHANKLSHPQNITSPSLWYDCDMTHRYEKRITAFFPLHIKSYVLIVYDKSDLEISCSCCFPFMLQQTFKNQFHYVIAHYVIIFFNVFYIFCIYISC